MWLRKDEHLGSLAILWLPLGRELSDSATADLRVKQNVDIDVESGCSKL